MDLTNKMKREGVEYLPEGNSQRSVIGGYHYISNHVGFRNLNICSNRDIAGLRSVDKRNIHSVENENSRYNGTSLSRIMFGVEIEKNRFHRNAVEEYPLFAGYETDSSCGYEAVTNILPLVKASVWRNKIYNMFSQAERIIDDRFSPSNNRCGGHMTFSVLKENGDLMNGNELNDKVRKFSGIILAIYRHRLSSAPEGTCYSGGNANLLNNRVRTRENTINSNDSRYTVINIKNDMIEFRLPSRIKSVKQLMRRYELFYTLFDFAINRPTANYKTFLKAVKPTLNLMYENDETKIKFIMDLSVEMQKMIKTGKVHHKIAHYFVRYSGYRIHNMEHRRFTREVMQNINIYHRGNFNSMMSETDTVENNNAPRPLPPNWVPADEEEINRLEVISDRRENPEDYVEDGDIR